MKRRNNGSDEKKARAYRNQRIAGKYVGYERDVNWMNEVKWGVSDSSWEDFDSIRVKPANTCTSTRKTSSVKYIKMPKADGKWVMAKALAALTTSGDERRVAPGTGEDEGAMKEKSLVALAMMELPMIYRLCAAPEKTCVTGKKCPRLENKWFSREWEA